MFVMRIIALVVMMNDCANHDWVGCPDWKRQSPIAGNVLGFGIRETAYAATNFGISTT